MDLKKIKWGGSGIAECLFRFIANKIPEGSIVVEIGSGACSTPALSSIYKLYSIEDNPNYINKYKSSIYIKAPLKNGWYDRNIVSKHMPKKCALVFVDGPVGEGNRAGHDRHVEKDRGRAVGESLCARAGSLCSGDQPHDS